MKTFRKVWPASLTSPTWEEEFGEFPTEREAVRFERYLKSGRAFAKRHFAPP